MTMVGGEEDGGEKVGISSLSKKWVIRRQAQEGATSVLFTVAGIEHSFSQSWQAQILVRKIRVANSRIQS